MHENEFKEVVCPCCKVGPDKLSNFLFCRGFWTAIFPSAAIVQNCSFSTPLDILGLGAEFNNAMVDTVAIGCSVYHEFKSSFPRMKANDTYYFDFQAAGIAASRKLRSSSRLQ